MWCFQPTCAYLSIYSFGDIVLLYQNLHIYDLGISPSTRANNMAQETM